MEYSASLSVVIIRNQIINIKGLWEEEGRKEK